MLQSEADCRLQPPEQDDKFTMSPMTPDGLIEAEHCLQLLASTAGPTTCWGPWQKQGDFIQCEKYLVKLN